MSDNPFKILNEESAPLQHGQSVREENKSADINERIKTLISSSDIFLFMKGTPEAPMCGFSANVVGILNMVKTPFKTFDVLSDWDIRDGVKHFSNWPTFPQLYVKGQLLGGNDVITEMFESGELQEALKV